MSDLTLNCTNPACQRLLSFDQALAGSIQQCPQCAQRIIVPELIFASPQTEIVPAASSIAHPISAPLPVAPQPVLPIREQQQQTEFHTARKLNMGAGCFAMMAVMFAVGILGAGASAVISSILPEFNGNLLDGLSFMLAGLLGLGAFVFFGYIATETASTSKGSERR